MNIKQIFTLEGLKTPTKKENKESKKSVFIAGKIWYIKGRIIGQKNDER